jgi:transcriptional regulator with XRE-family HTH domain
VASKLPKRQTSEDRRKAAHERRARWAQEVNQALAERGLSVHAAARQAGISPGALQAWLHQDVEPSPRAMEALAQVIGRRHLHLVSLLGWLPQELGEIPIQLEATFKLHEALAEAKRWVEAASAGLSFAGGSLIASAMLDASSDWEVILRHGIRGSHHQTRYITNVAFSRTGDPGPQDASREEPDTDRDRAEIQALIPSAFRQTGADWRPSERTRAWTWLKRRDLVLSAPVLLASKPRGLRPNLVVPPSLVVVGVPFCGAPEVGALLATSLDWAFADLPINARQRFGAAPGSPDELVGQAEIARGLLEDPAGAGRRLVWSYDDLEPLSETFQPALVGSELPLVVFLRISEDLIEYAAEQAPRDCDAAMIEAAQSRVRRLLQKRPADRSVVLDVPDLPIPPGSLHDVDLFFDAYVKLAFEAAQWLHKVHDGPALDDAPGLLGDLWRDGSRAGHPTAEA